MQIKPTPPVTYLTPPPAPALFLCPTTLEIYALLRAAPNGQVHVAPTSTPAPKLITEQAPNTVQPPRTPSPTLDRIRALTSAASITKMLREPRSQETAQRLAELRSLLSNDSVHALQSGPDKQEVINLLGELKQQLGLPNLQAQQKSAATEYKEQLSADRIRERTHSSDPEESYNNIRQVNQEVRYEEMLAKKRIQRSGPVVDALAAIGQSVNAPAPAPQPPATPPATASAPTAPLQQVYRFSDTTDSTAAQPREVLNFAHGKDRLDVSGIRAKLENKPLKLVEHFSGASGEMQIHYLPGTHTSVVIIAGEPGKPPFVLKVFGEVTFSDLIT